MPIVDVSSQDWRLSPAELERLTAEPAHVRRRHKLVRRRFCRRPYGEDEAGPSPPLRHQEESKVLRSRSDGTI
jgi:hypothetical protein